MSGQKLTSSEALREKYRMERDKRLRKDANDQYVEIAGKYSDMDEDPYVDPGFSRAPLTDETDVIVIGGGFGGLIAGARLRDAGIDSLRIVERAGDFGGTWYWNRYPGAACDIESYIYLPLLEETGYMPKEKYSRGPEIFEHAQRIATHYDLYKNAALQTQVTGMAWDEAASRWIIKTNHDDEMRAKFVIMSNGPLNRPKLPGIPGVESFGGHTFHTSRWDYDYTGGDVTGGLNKISDKRIGIIGTGATAIQAVPHLAEGAKELFVFQRTPSSVDVRNNHPTGPDFAASLEPGWHKHRMENFNTLVSGGYEKEDLVHDGWTKSIREIVFAAASGKDITKISPAEFMALSEQADDHKMNSVRARIEEIVGDSDTAEALKPWYKQFCKRPCFHDDYLPTFNKENVHLVDTDGQGVEAITPTGVVVAGKEYELDCLVFATGFEVGTSYTRRAGYDVEGRDGQTLSSAWEEGTRSLHGMFAHGFPNLVMLGGAQGGFTANYPHNLDEQAVHAAYVLAESKARSVDMIEPTKEAEQAWVDEIIAKAMMRDAFLAECTPGYYNNEGNVEARSRQNTTYGAGSVAYFKILAKWRDAGALEGLALTNA